MQIKAHKYLRLQIPMLISCDPWIQVKKESQLCPGSTFCQSSPSRPLDSGDLSVPKCPGWTGGALEGAVEGGDGSSPTYWPVTP